MSGAVERSCCSMCPSEPIEVSSKSANSAFGESVIELLLKYMDSQRRDSCPLPSQRVLGRYGHGLKRLIASPWVDESEGRRVS